jgi:hypothetical protein
MKKVINFFTFLTASLSVIAQNVGIGTTTPSEKLEVKNNLRSTLKISSASFNDTTQLLLSNRTVGNAGTDFSVKNMSEDGLYFSSQSDLPQNTANNILVLTPGGNVGVGTIPASANKFQVNGTTSLNGLAKIEGLNLIEFGAGVTGKEINAGKIGYNAFGQNALTFVGAGTNVSNRAVYFFAEGGVGMNGPLDIGGPLKINGNSGTAGQVLTSNGTGDPSWLNSAFGNATRFGISFTHTITTGHSLAPLTSLYNLTPADVTIGANNFTINKTGLYQFDIILNSSLSIPGTYATLNFYFHSGSMNFLNDEPVNVLGSSSLGKLNRSFSFSMHIIAGTVFSLGSYVALGTGGTNNGRIYCHLINE